jgi:prepilin-type N-terminal cleavage/methylation domain-containing protein
MKKKRQNGFTLIEGLVAIAILVLVISSVMGNIHSGFKSLLHSRDLMTATFLAQETIETVRNIRDINLSENQYWLLGLEDCLGNLCEISVFSSPVVNSCIDGVCQNLRYEDSNGRYGYDISWQDSDFVREIEILEETTSVVTVSVVVRWLTGEIKMKETLYDF